MMLYGIGTFSPLEGQRSGESSSAAYHKLRPRFLNTLDELSPAPAIAPAADSHYSVKKGDTLAEIVRRQLQSQGRPADNVAVFDAVRRVASQNHLHNANQLQIGQVLDLGALGAAVAPGSAPSSAKLAPAPPAAVEVLPPLPPKTSRSGIVQVKPLANLEETPSSVADVNGGGGRRSQVGPLASFASARSVMISPGPQGGPSHPLSRGLLAELAPTVHYPSAATRVSGRPDLNSLLDRLLDPKASSAEDKVLSSPAAPAAESASAPWERAVDGPVRVTSGFGVRKDPFNHRPDFHEGLDLAAASGSDIHPLSPGTVTFSGWKSGYGRVVIVDHGDGTESVYGHNSKNLVAVGQQVTEKTVLGHVGATGRATGPHLHLEVRQNGKPVDPVAYLTASSVAPTDSTRLAENE